MNTLRGLGSFKKPGDVEPNDSVSVNLTENVGTIVKFLWHKTAFEKLSINVN